MEVHIVLLLAVWLAYVLGKSVGRDRALRDYVPAPGCMTPREQELIEAAVAEVSPITVTGTDGAETTHDFQNEYRRRANRRREAAEMVAQTRAAGGSR